MSVKKIKEELSRKADAKKAVMLIRFFKTGKGEYAEGDKFIGVMVPEQRKIANRFADTISTNETARLLKSSTHEERLTALIILVLKYKKGSETERQKIYKLYLKNTKYINNWDLVDVTCKDIVGAYLFAKSRSPLYKLAKSKNLWEKRIAIISTSYFIGRNDFRDTMKIAEILLGDKHDLIYKAVGWMLREVGKRSIKTEIIFLNKYSKIMPRTMLQYAIEKFPEKLRQKYLKKETLSTTPK